MLKAAVVILVIMLAYAGIYSLMSIIVPKMMTESSFKAVTGEALDSVKDAGYLKAYAQNPNRTPTPKRIQGSFPRRQGRSFRIHEVDEGPGEQGKVERVQEQQ